MDFQKLVSDIVVPLVNNPDNVKVIVEEDESKLYTIKILVDKEDIGRVIGRKGVTANAIREIVSVGAKKERVRARVQIDSK